MKKDALAVVLGDSLLMEMVRTSLRNGLALDMVRMDAYSPDIIQFLSSLKPELVIFELDAPRPCAILSLLKEQPNTLFLGFDPSSSQVTIFKSNQSSIRTLEELCQLVKTELGCAARLQEGSEIYSMLSDHPITE